MAVVVTLAGSATDDGRPNPPGALTYQWSKVSGPGDATFVDNTDPATDVELSLAGIYVLRLTASDGVLNSQDEVIISAISSAPDFGLVLGVQNIVGIGSDGFLYRTADFQTVSGSGGPTWTRVDLGIAAKIYSWVVDPFSPGYLTGVGSIDGWIVNDTDIYRVEDLFGTPSVVSVYTFDVATVGADLHWRTIQASFGAYFAEGLNPWLVCTSYYGNTVQHEGAWAVRSEDGGVTWSEEVNISSLYDGDELNPIAVWTSPRTPGKAYTAAHVSVSTGPLPRWATWDSQASNLTAGELSGSASVLSRSESDDLIVTVEKYLWLCPPPNTKRIAFIGSWVSNFSSPGTGTGTNDSTVDIQDSSSTTLTDDLVHSVPGQSDTATTSGTFSGEVTFANFATQDWPVNTVNYLTGNNSNALRFRCRSVSNGSATNHAVCVTNVGVKVTEIELDDGTIYNPSATEVDGFVSLDWGETWTAMGGNPVAPEHGFAGTIHVPWPDNSDESLVYHGWLDDVTNRQFRLKKVSSGVPTDVSPSDIDRSYGINRGPFGVRSLDTDSQHLLMAGIGNIGTNDPADDYHGVFKSADGGSTWSVVVTPTQNSGALAGRPLYEAAFSPDDPDTFFVWGAENYISYTSSGIAGIDLKAGNLSSFGSVYLIGIAGGPSG